MKTLLEAQQALNCFQFAELYHAINTAREFHHNNKHQRYTHTGDTGVFYFRWTDAGELHLDKFEERR